MRDDTKDTLMLATKIAALYAVVLTFVYIVIS